MLKVLAAAILGFGLPPAILFGGDPDKTIHTDDVIAIAKSQVQRSSRLAPIS